MPSSFFPSAANLPPPLLTPAGVDVTCERAVMLRMRDGVELAMDIYRPVAAANGEALSLPVLLQRTPYDKTRNMRESAEFFARHGYIVVIQDCRGRFKSGGKFTKYVSEAEDGYDTIEALARLRGADGQVGMFGGSYLAHTQAAAAQLNPPHLATMVLTVGGLSNAWTHSVRNHGAFALKQLTWAFAEVARDVRDPVSAAALKRETLEDWFQLLPWERGQNPLSCSPEFEDYLFELMTHGNYDDFWKRPGLNWSEHYAQTADVPMIHVSGWYDAYCGSALENQIGLAGRGKGPVRLLMGPWEHGTIDRSWAGEVDFGSDAVIADYYRGWHLRWFDHFLKGADNGIASEPPVRVFVMGTGDGCRDPAGRLRHGGYWRTAECWPLPDTRFERYYLHANGRLSTAIPAADEASITYTFDPEHPVPTIGGSMAASQPLWMGGPFDQRERPFAGDPARGFYGSRPPFPPLKGAPLRAMCAVKGLHTSRSTRVQAPIARSGVCR